MKKIIETLASYFAISIQKNFPLYCTTGYCAIIFTYCCDIVTCSCPLSFSFMVYAVRMLFFGLALLIAARPDLDNPGCYRDGWDYFRGVCEGISIIFFLFKLGDEIQEIFRYVAASSIAQLLQVLWRVIPHLHNCKVLHSCPVASQRYTSRTTTTTCS